MQAVNFAQVVPAQLLLYRVDSLKLFFACILEMFDALHFASGSNCILNFIIFTSIVSFVVTNVSSVLLSKQSKCDGEGCPNLQTERMTDVHVCVPDMNEDVVGINYPFVNSYLDKLS